MLPHTIVGLKIFFLLLQGDPLMVKVNKLTSTKTQLPYSYYSLPYCRPGKILDSAENLGEVLRGDRIENSPYVVRWNSCIIPWSFYVCYSLVDRSCLSQFKMREPQMCSVVCQITLDKKTARAFKEKIDDEYRVNM